MNKILGGGVVVAVVLSVVALLSGGNTSVVERVIEKTGATPGSEVFTNNFSFGGVRHWAYNVPLKGTAASTTVCVIPAPPNASSSLQFFSYAANSATGTQMDLIAYRSASPWVNTTAITDRVLVAGNTHERIVSTTTTMNSSANVFTNGQYLVVRSVVGAGGNGTSSPTNGACQAVFTEL